MKYTHNIVQHLLPYGVSDIVISFFEKPRQQIINDFQKSLLCIEYYGLLCQTEINSMFSGHKIISIDKHRPHIVHYVMQNEITPEGRRHIIKMFKNLNNVT